MNIEVRRVLPEEADPIASMVQALTEEITAAIGEKQFNIDLAETSARCRQFLEREVYLVYQAVRADTNTSIGFIALCESHALYAGGAFGVIQEIYVHPAHRSRGIGRKLIEAAIDQGRQRGWTRLEVCTPPLPEFAGSLTFYERHHFEITGGRKMKILL